MEATDEQHEDTCQDTERSPNLKISRLPDEVLLEIFDCYRHDIDPYDYQWKEKYVWFNLTHVCQKWRSVMLASSSRLDLGITVGPQKPGNIKTILSGPFPILIDYKCADGDIAGSALWRLRAALRHHDRVREISFKGKSADFNIFFKATDFPFPVLESLVLKFVIGDEPKFPDTFLTRGPDPSVSHLRSLRLSHVSLANVSGFLSSATALTELFLAIDAAGTTLLACLQGMPCLRSLVLLISCRPPGSPWQPSTPKDIVSLSKLTSFHYFGKSVFLDALVAGLSAPSLLNVNIDFLAEPPIVHLPRFIDEIKEHYHAVHVVFRSSGSSLKLLHSEYISHCKSPFEMGSFLIHSWICPPLESIIRMSGTLSTRLTTMEALCVTFDKTANNLSGDYVAWRRFYQQFPSVKALRIEGANSYRFARPLLQDHEEPDSNLAFFPALEEIEFEQDSSMAAFQPFVSARQQAGRPLKVSFGRSWAYHG